jgi:hypothetical protein
MNQYKLRFRARRFWPPSHNYLILNLLQNFTSVRSFSRDPKTVKTGRSLSRLSFGFPDKSMHPRFDCMDERRHFALRSFDLELHPPIRQVFYPTGDLKFFRGLQGAVTETDALHPAVKKHRLVIYFRHKIARKLPKAANLVQLAKITRRGWREPGFCVALSQPGQHGAAHIFYATE